MLAHELRNPLAAIFSAVELLRQSDDVDLVLARIEAVIERQGRHMARLLDELLDISRVTHGKIELRKRAIDLCSLVRDTVLANETVIRGREHHVITDLADDPLWIAADPTRLEQVLTNLLHNAVKYMEPGGTIHVSTAGRKRSAPSCWSAIPEPESPPTTCPISSTCSCRRTARSIGPREGWASD